MRRIDPVLRREAPVAPDHAPVAVGRDIEVVVEKAGLYVLDQRRRVAVADEDEDDVLPFLDMIGPERELADQRTLGVGDDRHQPAVPEIVGEAVIPAGHRVGRVAFGPRRKRNPAMGATVLNRVDATADTLEQHPFGEELQPQAFPFRDLFREAGGVPVIAEAQRRLQIGRPGLVVEIRFRLGRHVRFAVRHAYPLQSDRKPTTRRLNASACSTCAQWPHRAKMCIWARFISRVI